MGTDYRHRKAIDNMKKYILLLTITLFTLLCINASAKTVLLGDIDSSGIVTASDARTVIRASARLEAISDELIPVADADRNGKITSLDARKILRFATRLDASEAIELSDTVYVNRFMPDSDSLELFAAGCEVKKQDGFVFTYKDEIYIIDGGHKSTGEDSVYTYLMNLRRELLPEGVQEADENYKLKITVILSHFHTDHMNTYIHDIIPSPFIEIAGVYLTEQSVFESTPLYGICDPDYYSDGVIETKGRLRFLKLLEEYSTETTLEYVPFGEIMQIKSKDGKVTFDLFAPSEDWGTPERAQHLLDLYYESGKSRYTAADLPKAVVNANSMWLKITYGDRSMLFTGDVMKRAKNAYSPDSPNYAEEPFDVMLSYYADKCGEDVFDADIVKFPHHGQVRAEASKGVFEVFSPEFIICTATNFRETTVEKAQKYWDKYNGAYCLSDGNGMHIATDGKSVTVKKDNGTSVIFDSDGNRTDVAGEILVK